MNATVTILNPWDSQGNQITDGMGIYPCIRGCGGGGYQQGYVLQHINDAQMDDRVICFDVYNMADTGKVSKTLNSVSSDADHVPVICLEGNGARPSHMGNGYSECGTMYTLNTIEQHSVCYCSDLQG